MSVTVIDYGLGNLGSVMNMLKRIGADPALAKEPRELAAADRLLLPGVGAFDRGMGLLRSKGLDEAILDFAESGRPLLGICLGMQLLFQGSEEGEATGLSLIPGRSTQFDTASGIRIPHMGWNHATPVREHPLFHEMPSDSRFYFVHSFHVVPTEAETVLATTEYGSAFASAVASGNIIGAQFHPEKSHSYGMRLLRNFCAL